MTYRGRRLGQSPGAADRYDDAVTLQAELMLIHAALTVVMPLI